MANEQAWRDFEVFTQLLYDISNRAEEIKNLFVSLNKEKINILDDQDRYDEIEKIVLEHPDYTMASLGTDFTKCKNLSDWIIANF